MWKTIAASLLLTLVFASTAPAQSFSETTHSVRTGAAPSAQRPPPPPPASST